MSQETTNRSFDELARGLAGGRITRGKAIRLMGAALLGGTLASFGIGEASADPIGCKRNGKACKKDTQCCSGKCVGGTCAVEPPPTPTPNGFMCYCVDGPISGCTSINCFDQLQVDQLCLSQCASLGGVELGSSGCFPNSASCA